MMRFMLFLLYLALPGPPAPSRTDPEPPSCRVERMDVTAYCLPGRTATGTRGHVGTCAGPRRLLGRRVRVCGWPYQVTDICPAGHLDLWLPTRAQCMRWGRRTLPVEIEGD